MAIGAVSNMRLRLIFDEGSYSFSQLKLDSSDSAILTLGEAINALQIDKAKLIIKQVTTHIA